MNIVLIEICRDELNRIANTASELAKKLTDEGAPLDANERQLMSMAKLALFDRHLDEMRYFVFTDRMDEIESSIKSLKELIETF